LVQLADWKTDESSANQFLAASDWFEIKINRDSKYY